MVSQYFPIPQVPIPQNTTKIALGKIRLGQFSPLIQYIVFECKTDYIINDTPLS